MKYLWLMLWAVLCMSGCRHATPSTPKVISDTTQRVLSLGQTSVSDTIDLGRLHAGEVVRMTVNLRNDASRPVLILAATTSCGCTSVEYERHPIAPSHTGSISFTFDSKGFYGYQLKQIRLRTSLGTAPYTLWLTAEVE
ncbi:MAG: DUF1573 domain-containing protein [Alistipes sp.]|nr:DUF1573 domain-containing protein [Alistipes sp.]